ncbi:hypothetical protein C1H46_009200 [Malus baccata]|uniref:Uncharacterized protein n=1 Tax=Malus baccata TaxID=106549 RepID=A0A540N2E5_MALBA|nr:hypothetical protein C1H46_009200 [Malus baccata]
MPLLPLRTPCHVGAAVSCYDGEAVSINASSKSISKKQANFASKHCRYYHPDRGADLKDELVAG